MFKNGIIILFLNLIVTTIVGQNQVEIDRIHSLLPKAISDEEKLLHLSDLSWEYSSYDQDSSLFYARKTLELAKKSKNSSYLATAFNRIGLAYDNFNQLDSAIKNYNIALNIRFSLEDTLAASNTLNDIGACYFYQSLLDSAAKYYLKAAELRYKIKDDKSLAQSYNNLGLVHRKQENYAKAIEFYQLSLKLKEQLKDEFGVLNTLSNISVVYQQQYLFKEAEQYSIRALDLAQKINSALQIALEKNSLGVIYRNIGKLDEAEVFLLEANKVLVANGRKDDLAMNLNNLGILYSSKNQLEKASKYLEQSLAIALSLNRIELAKENYLALAAVYENSNSKKAYDYLKQGTVLKDSLINESKLKYINSLSEKYQAKQRDLEIKQLQSDNEIKQLLVENSNKKRQNTLLVLVAVLVVLVLLVGLFFNIRKTAKELKSKNLTINKSLEEKEVLLREIHHRVKNNLQIITGLLELQESLHADEKIGNIVAEAQGRIKTMAIIHEMLYQTDDIANIQLQNYAQLLVSSIESGFVSKTVVNKFFDLNNVHFNIDTIIPLGLILNELVSNAFKYVFVPNHGNSLFISIKKVEQENWQLTIKDDGKGISNNGVGEREGSFGLRLVKMLARQLKGKVEYSYENGSKFCITFKELNLIK